MVALNCVPDAVSNMASVKKKYINFHSQHTYCQLLSDKLQHVLSLNKAIIKHRNINPAINSLYITSLCMYQNGMYTLKKIASTGAEVQCTIWFGRFTPIATTEHNFQHMYGSVLPSASLTCQGFIQLIEKGNKLKQKLAGRQQTSEEDAEWVRVSCLWGPRPHYSLLQLTIPHTIIQNVLHPWPEHKLT